MVRKDTGIVVIHNPTATPIVRQETHGRWIGEECALGGAQFMKQRQKPAREWNFLQALHKRKEVTHDAKGLKADLLFSDWQKYLRRI